MEEMEVQLRCTKGEGEKVRLMEKTMLYEQLAVARQSVLYCFIEQLGFPSSTEQRK
jgi:hypothetical protein